MASASVDGQGAQGTELTTGLEDRLQELEIKSGDDQNSSDGDNSEEYSSAKRDEEEVRCSEDKAQESIKDAAGSTNETMPKEIVEPAITVVENRAEPAKEALLLEREPHVEANNEQRAEENQNNGINEQNHAQQNPAVMNQGGDPQNQAVPIQGPAVIADTGNQADQAQGNRDRSHKWETVSKKLVRRFSNQTEFEKFARSSRGLKLEEDEITEEVCRFYESPSETKISILRLWRKINSEEPHCTPDGLQVICDNYFKSGRGRALWPDGIPQRLEDAFQDLIIPAFANQAHFNNFARSSIGLQIDEDALVAMQKNHNKDCFRYMMEVLKHWRMISGENATSAAISELKNNYLTSLRR